MQRSALMGLACLTAALGCARPEGVQPRPGPSPACAADGVLRGSLHILDQQGLDRLAGCERIIGNLSLMVFPGIDEAPLLSLRDVEGWLWIYASREGPVPNPIDGFRALEEAREILLSVTLTSLEPFARLRRIGVATSGPEYGAYETPWHDVADSTSMVSPPAIRPGLTLLACSELSSLAGLDALEEVDGIDLSDNDDLVSVAGMPSLTDLPELRVTGCPLLDLQGIESGSVRDLFIHRSSLTSLEGLGDAQALQRLTLRENAALESLEGGVFPRSMASLELLENPRLARTAGLEGLREVGTLSIETGAGSLLESLSGLSGLEQASVLRVLRQRRLPSLAGLEALRSVQALRIEQNSALRDVQALSGLQSVGEFSLSGSEELASLSGLGSVSVDRMQLSDLGLTDLTGLERVRIAHSLVVSGMGALSTLRGLPELAADAEVELSALGGLASVEALQGVTALGALSIRNTALTDLDALRELRQLGSLQLWGNAQLVQLDALSELSGLLALEVNEHPLLRSLPTFANLTDGCESCAAFRLQLWNNPSLETGPGLPLLERAQDITVVSNDSLIRLTGLSSLRSVESLRILHNRALIDLDLGGLQQAGQIGIYGNAELDDAALQPLAQLPLQQVQILSNRSGPAQLAPCPWTEDFICDEATGVCASGTDFPDCPER